MLTRHEIVDDVIGGVPVAVTFCPLCNMAVVFDRRLGERVLEFGVSGFLRNSYMPYVCYDSRSQPYGFYDGPLPDSVGARCRGWSAWAKRPRASIWCASGGVSWSAI